MGSAEEVLLRVWNGLSSTPAVPLGRDWAAGEERGKGDGTAQGALENSPEGEEDSGEAFDFEDSEEEGDRSQLVVSNARTELGTRGALQDPPRRRRSSISDDLEPLDDWEAEEALLEGGGAADPVGLQRPPRLPGLTDTG
ncbi:hypothetical protein lerEdw1_003103 [Lerista edwardsae]|nr:hypothetical protein lerEdw1_003103 [Lerista edwardsae]